jgi:hypothetical protein
MPLRFATAFVVGVMLSAPVSAETVLLFDNFDGYADQADFNNTWPPIAPQPSGTLSMEQAESLPHSVKFAPIATPTSGNAERNQRFFTESGAASASNLVHFEFDFFDTDAAAAPYRQFSGVLDSSAPNGSGALVQLGLNNNQMAAHSGGNYYMARILGYDPSVDGEDVGGPSSFFKLNGPGTPLRSTGWHKLGVTISNTDFKFYVDGILARTVTNNWTLRSYDEIRIGSGLSNAGNAAYVDNVKMSLNPTTGIGLVGDYNDDDQVDAADYVVWRANEGSNNVLPNDPIGGTIGSNQYDNWVANFGESAMLPAAASQRAVPEPRSIVLLLIAMTGAASKPKRRRASTLSVLAAS